MRKLITLVLLVFALALGASVMAAPDPGSTELGNNSIPDGLVNALTAPIPFNPLSGAVTEVLPEIEATAYAEDAVSVADPDTEPATPAPQEGEPAETTFRILMALTILTGAGALLKFTNPLRKRTARTLLFQPPQTT
jgi:hypothetical protein